MTPVDQEFKHSPGHGVNGDCQRAVIASLLDLPLSDVPHFLDGLTTDAEADGIEFERKVQAFLGRHGYCRFEWKDGPGVIQFMQRRFGIGQVFHEIYGPSPRDPKVLHAVVGCNGKIVHDPHPSRAGLAGDQSEWGFCFLFATCDRAIQAVARKPGLHLWRLPLPAVVSRGKTGRNQRRALDLGGHRTNHSRERTGTLLLRKRAGTYFRRRT